MKKQFVKEYDRRIAESINKDIENYKSQYHIVSMTSVVTDYDEGIVLVLWESDENQN